MTGDIVSGDDYQQAIMVQSHEAFGRSFKKSAANHLAGSRCNELACKSDAGSFLFIKVEAQQRAKTIFKPTFERQCPAFPDLRPARRSGFLALCSLNAASKSDFETFTSLRIISLNCSNGCGSGFWTGCLSMMS
jgi:hypothetical protein